MPQSGKTIFAFAIGVFISVVPYYLTVDANIELSGLLRFVAECFWALFIPGLLIGLVAGRGVHDPNMILALIANSLFYGFTLRLIFRKFWKDAPGDGTEE